MVDMTIAAYPMVGEGEATGQVAVVYADILEQMPLVPSIFKSLALCPPYLAIAWAQAAPVLGGDELAAAADALVVEAAGVVTPPPDDEVGDALGRFVGPLAKMLVLGSGLRLALAGELTGPPAEVPDAAGDAGGAPRELATDFDIPATGAASDTSRFGQIRAELGTPIVNSIWRFAADRGLLDAAWDHLGPQIGGPDFTATSERLAARARTAAAELDWPVVASLEAAEQMGAADALPGMAAVLDAYLVTLPRVLTLVAGCAPAGD